MLASNHGVSHHSLLSLLPSSHWVSREFSDRPETHFSRAHPNDSHRLPANKLASRLVAVVPLRRIRCLPPYRKYLRRKRAARWRYPALLRERPRNLPPSSHDSPRLMDGWIECGYAPNTVGMSGFITVGTTIFG